MVSQVLHKPVFHDSVEYLCDFKGKKVSVSIGTLLTLGLQQFELNFLFVSLGSSLISGILKDVSSVDILVESDGSSSRFAWKDPNFVFLRIDDDSVVPEQILAQKNQLVCIYS